MNKEVEDLIQEIGNTGADKKIKNKIKATIDREIVKYEDFLKIKYQALFPSHSILFVVGKRGGCILKDDLFF